MLKTKLQHRRVRHVRAMNQTHTSGHKAANGTNGRGPQPVQLQCIDKIHEIPVLESAILAVGGFYCRLKKINPVTEWSLGAAESKLSLVAHYTLSSSTLQLPLHLADVAVCYGLGFVEDKLPAIKQQPQEILSNVRGMVSEKAGAIARPVLVRANSVKEVAARSMHTACDFGLQRADKAMNTRVGAIAAESIDVGLELAEQLLDTYLPPESSDEAIVQQRGEDETDFKKNSSADQHRALNTVHRVDRLTRTLQRRLTRRTLAQVKSLREHAMDAITVLLGLAKTAVTDPKGSADYLAFLWRDLSKDEPENQPPPETLEQRTTLLARESARRLVHVVNAVAALPITATNKFTHLVIEVLHSLRLDGAAHAVAVQSRQRIEQLQAFMNQINSIASQILAAAAKTERTAPVPHDSNSNNHQPAGNASNNHSS